MNGKKGGLLKQRMATMKMKTEQKLNIRPNAQDGGSLCDAFLLFRDYTKYFLLLSLFWDMEHMGKKAGCVVIDRRIRA